MSEIKAKVVRTLAPAGVSINFVGICGNSHHYYPTDITLIKLMLDRNILVYEKLAEPAEDGSTEVLLTLENYDQDNDGEEVAEDAVIIPNIEKQIQDAHAAEREDFLAEKGLEIKDKQEKTYKEYLNIPDEEPIDEELITTEEILNMFNLSLEDYNALREDIGDNEPTDEILAQYNLTREQYGQLVEALESANDDDGSDGDDDDGSDGDDDDDTGLDGSE